MSIATVIGGCQPSTKHRLQVGKHRQADLVPPAQDLRGPARRDAFRYLTHTRHSVIEPCARSEGQTEERFDARDGETWDVPVAEVDRTGARSSRTGPMRRAALRESISKASKNVWS